MTCYHLFLPVGPKPPKIKCPKSVKVRVEFGQESAIANWTDPVANNDTGLIRAVWCSHIKGTNFTIGVTRVYCFANDTNGNIGKCRFKIRVKGKKDSIVKFIQRIIPYT